MDGIDDLGNGQYMVSSWQPTQITVLNNTFGITETISINDMVNPADICYAKETGALAIPSTSTELIIYQYFFSEIGIDDKEIQPLKFWPNPAEGSLQLDLTEINGEVKVSLFDLSGKLVTELYNGNTALMGELDLEEVPSGNYLIRLESEDEVYSSKLIKK